MIRVSLSVTDAGPEEPGGILDLPDWGTWDFVSLPRAGDILELNHDGRDHLLIVERVVHFVVQHPLPRTERPYLQRKEPSIRIVARRSSRIEPAVPLPRQWQMLA